MTTERKKAILFLVLTLVAGILIGTLIPGTMGRFHRRGGERGGYGKGHQRMADRRGEHGFDRRAWLMHTVFRVVHPDSTQAQKMRPIVKEASHKIQAIGKRGQEEVMGIMDSLKIQLKPIL